MVNKLKQLSPQNLEDNQKRETNGLNSREKSIQFFPTKKIIKRKRKKQDAHWVVYMEEEISNYFLQQ